MNTSIITNHRNAYSIKIVVTIFILLHIFVVSWAQKSEQKPKIGLVLGGGAVKGMAHIGVIKVLVEEGIIPDYIAGTSIGAIVGSLYAMGYDTSQLYHMARSTSWSDFFNDDWSRLYYSPHLRDRDEPYFVKLAISGGSLLLPKSYVYGEKLSLLLSNFTLPAHNIEDFNAFKIPFRCVAADLATGKAKVFDSGNLALALRASMSLPSIFEPVIIDGVTYIDGGIVRNLPVQDALDMGADFTIAVDVSADLFQPHEIKSALDMLDQSISYRINESNETQRKLASIVIKPDLDGLNGFSFDRIDTLLKRGEEAARKALPEIKEKLNLSTFSETQKNSIAYKSYKINKIIINGLDENSQKTIKNILKLHFGETYSIEELENRLIQAYTQGWVRQINYQLLEGTDDHYAFHIDAQAAPKTWIKLGANYDSDMKAGLLLSAERRNLLVSGSTLSGDARISENPMGHLEYDFNNILLTNAGFKLQARANFSPAFAYVQGRKVNEFKLHRLSAGASFYMNIFQNGLLSAGIYREQFTQNRQLFEPSKDETRLTQTLIPLTFTFDTYDRIYFPNKGFQFFFNTSVALKARLERITEMSTFDYKKGNYLIQSYYRHVMPITSTFAVILNADFGIINYEVNTNVYAFYLGRALEGEQTHVAFTGLPFMGQTATQYILGRIQMRWEFNKDLFLTLTGNYGNTESKARRQTTRQELVGGGIEFGAKTFIGPIKLSFEYGNIHPNLVTYLHIGHIF